MWKPKSYSFDLNINVMCENCGWPNSRTILYGNELKYLPEAFLWSNRMHKLKYLSIF